MRTASSITKNFVKTDCRTGSWENRKNARLAKSYKALEDVKRHNQQYPERIRHIDDHDDKEFVCNVYNTLKCIIICLTYM